MHALIHARILFTHACTHTRTHARACMHDMRARAHANTYACSPHTSTRDICTSIYFFWCGRYDVLRVFYLFFVAEQMGHLLGFPFLKISCEKYSSRFELFGGTFPYKGAEHGSMLNNFISQHSGRPSIVLLDEFEKIEDEARESFMNVFERVILLHCLYFLRNNYYTCCMSRAHLFIIQCIFIFLFFLFVCFHIYV